MDMTKNKGNETQKGTDLIGGTKSIISHPGFINMGKHAN